MRVRRNASRGGGNCQIALSPNRNPLEDVLSLFKKLPSPNISPSATSNAAAAACKDGFDDREDDEDRRPCSTVKYIDRIAMITTSRCVCVTVCGLILDVSLHDNHVPVVHDKLSTAIV